MLDEIGDLGGVKPQRSSNNGNDFVFGKKLWKKEFNERSKSIQSSVVVATIVLRTITIVKKLDDI